MITPSLDGRLKPSGVTRAMLFTAASLAISGTYYVYDSIGPVAELLSSQRGLSGTKIGSLNAIYSLPNILMAFLGGLLIDRFGPRAVLCFTGAVCLAGAVLTAIGEPFPLMLVGRLLFGTGAETLMVAVLVALTRWFEGRSLALVLAVNVSLGRLGSYLADRSPSWAHSWYADGWQAPLWLAATAAFIAFGGVCAYGVIEKRIAPRHVPPAVASRDRIHWRSLFDFRREYWYLTAICVAFYSVIFPFRSTFAIQYFQQTRTMTLEDASRINSYVFLAAIVSMPIFGAVVDRVGRHARWLTIGALALPTSFLLLGETSFGLALPTVLLGLSFSLVPAVLWPAVTLYVPLELRGTAYGLMAAVQNLGLALGNLLVGWLNDMSHASAEHPQGYVPMLWFFGLLGTTGFLAAARLQWQHGR